MAKLKHETELVKAAIVAGVKYAEDRGAAVFEPTDSASEKILYIYRLLVHDKVIQPLPEDKVSQQTMRVGEIPNRKETTSKASDGEEGFNNDIGNYKRVDTVGVPFLDAALNEREGERQIADNRKLARHYVIRFAHLGWGFGPSIDALGLKTCFKI